jgi:hypothetical protein
VKPFRGTDPTGRSTARATGGRRRSAELPEKPFVARGLRMMRSPAWRELSAASKLVLERLEIEHMEHGGTRNGDLPCTHRDFVEHGVRAGSVRRALDEAIALGFLKTELPGRRKVGAAPGRAARFRLTYLPHVNGDTVAATNEWAAFASREDARRALDNLKGRKSASPPERRKVAAA